MQMLRISRHNTADLRDLFTNIRLTIKTQYGCGTQQQAQKKMQMP